MDDWEQPADEEREPAAAVGPVWRAAAADPEAVDALAAFLAEAKSPALVVGAGADDPETWAALVELAERLVAPVFQESFGGRAGSRRTTRSIAEFCRPSALGCGSGSRPYDTILVVGAAAFRQAPYVPGSLHAPGTRIAVVGEDPDEVYRSPAEVAVLASPAAVCRELADRVAAARAQPPEPLRPPPPRAARAGRASLGEPRARRARRAAAARRRRRRGSAGRPARDPCAAARPRASRLPQRSPRRPRLRHAGGGRSAHGLAEPAGRGRRRRRLGNLRRAGRLERRALRDRRALRRPLERALRGHGPARRAPRRHRSLARRSPRSSWRRSRAASAARPADHDSRRADRALDEVVPTLAERAEPLVLDVLVAPTLDFAP